MNNTTWCIIIYLETKAVWLTQAANKEEAIKNVFGDKPKPKEGLERNNMRVFEVKFNDKNNCLLT